MLTKPSKCSSCIAGKGLEIFFATNITFSIITRDFSICLVILEFLLGKTRNMSRSKNAFLSQCAMSSTKWVMCLTLKYDARKVVANFLLDLKNEKKTRGWHLRSNLWSLLTHLSREIVSLKGQSNKLFDPHFFHPSNLPGPLTNGLKYFRFWLRFSRVIWIFTGL